MLRATNELFGLGLSDDDLLEIAAGLGSDVPFFVRGGSAIVEGFGERIEPHDEIRPLFAVIAFPEASCPTGPVYAEYDEIGPRPLRPDAVRALAAAAGALRTEAVFNDLSDAAVRLAPALQDPAGALSRLAECPAQVAGSGSSLFVLCDDETHASHLADAVTRQLGLPAVAVRSAPVPEPTTIGSP
jgi:4-diphosphocytidyl-2-C-methyl-D-erythritol kinase